MRILAFAYACEPDRGSEPGAGWLWARMIAGYGDVTVITRANNREVIEAALPGTPERDRLRFVYVDLPHWARFWKRGHRGVHLYYLLWQFAALRAAQRLHRTKRFDLVWHLTFANVWMGSAAALVRAPFVYGPVGGAVKTPWRLLGCLNLRGIVREAALAISRAAGRYVNPLSRLAISRARVVLVQNPETLSWLPARHRSRAVVFSNAVIDEPASTIRERESGTTALYAGQLIPGKAVVLAVRALVDLPEWKLIICGKGPERGRLERLARRLRVADRVVFAGWVPRPEVSRLMVEDADVFLFPSLHEGSSWVLHEARAARLPVVCLDGCGSSSIATVLAPVGWPRATARGLADAVRRASTSERTAGGCYDLESRRRQLTPVLRDVGFKVECTRVST
jgi:glycosyltransferase involved in cell wall biosynthesis